MEISYRLIANPATFNQNHYRELVITPPLKTVELIFSFLNSNDLTQCQSVCKDWKWFIKDKFLSSNNEVEVDVALSSSLKNTHITPPVKRSQTESLSYEQRQSKIKEVDTQVRKIVFEAENKKNSIDYNQIIRLLKSENCPSLNSLNIEYFENCIDFFVDQGNVEGLDFIYNEFLQTFDSKWQAFITQKIQDSLTTFILKYPDHILNPDQVFNLANKYLTENTLYPTLINTAVILKKNSQDIRPLIAKIYEEALNLIKKIINENMASKNDNDSSKFLPHIAMLELILKKCTELHPT